MTVPHANRVARLLALAFLPLLQQASSQFLELPDENEPPPCIGQTPSNVVIDQALPYPETGSLPYVVLRNVGGKVANLTNWKLTDADGTKPLVFDGQAPCDGPSNFTIEPSRTLTIMPGAPCGFDFELNFNDEINLLDANGSTVSSVAWDNPTMGSVLYRMQDGFTPLTAMQNVVELMEEMGEHDLFLEALEATGLAEKLQAASDPAYEGPAGPPPKKQQLVVPEFPWWFGFGVDRSKIPPPPPPPPPPPAPPAGVPDQGPFTVLAPTNDAFASLLQALGGGRQLPKEQFFQLPELTEILRYHILPGRVTTGDMYNNTGIFSTQGPAVTPFVDACMTEGATRLHDSCIDKPTPDNFTCLEQKTFEKCYFPFMTSALAAQWQGGFCQSTCERCSCADDSGIQCAEVVMPDVIANNGVVHAIDRVLFPPPVFTKEMYANMTLDPALAAALNASQPLDVPQGDTPSAVTAPAGMPFPTMLNPELSATLPPLAEDARVAPMVVMSEGGADD